MKLGVTSDLHGNLPEVEQCDVLCICGDIMPLDIQRNMVLSERWLKTTFARWIDSLPCTYVYLVAGNHDFYLENIYNNKEKQYEILTKPTSHKLYFLHDTSQLIAEYNITIYGTPWCHKFGNWAFMRDEEFLTEKYYDIPKDLDVLLTHDPPTLCGLGTIYEGFHYGEVAGNMILSHEIRVKKPKYVFSGHIHSGEHELQEFEGIKMANVSLVNERYQVANKILYLDI